MDSSRRGIVRKWFDEKGYGFIQPLDGESLLFFHASSVRNSDRRDLVGQRVTFRETLGRDGRAAADDVFLASGAGELSLRGLARPRSHRRGFRGGALVAWVGALGFLGFLFFGSQRGQWPVYVVYAYGAMSVLTFLAYWSDKKKANVGHWRTPERTLHMLELLGGWPGALVAQWQIGHKNRKGSYQWVFWLIVLIHVGILGRVFAKFES